MNQSTELSLLFDLGTNGEVVLGNSDWLICCSASAGPAFEGGGLKCGIRATDGAIERVAINQAGKLAYKVIGNSRPRGICGSGFIDLAAELFKTGYLDKAGRFVREIGNSHLREGETGLEFVLVPADKTATGREITVSENDLAIFIRSKGAIYTAAEALLNRVGSSFPEVARVYISGGFGNYVDVGNALAIGLLPDLPLERFHFIGNGSLNGSRMCLASREALAETEAIAARMTYFDLSTDPKFMGDFTSSLFLPHTDLEKFPSVARMLKGKKRWALIAVSGKGGSGKTTTAALIVKYLLSRSRGPVFAVDADPNSNLADSLGVEEYGTVGGIREELSANHDPLPAGMSRAGLYPLSHPGNGERVAWLRPAHHGSAQGGPDATAT